MLYDDDGSIVFQWNEQDAIMVTAIGWSWQFPDNWRVPVSMQFGNELLSDRSYSAIIPAVAHGNAVSFTANRPVDDLLRPADQVVVRTTGAQLSIRLQPAKIATLLTHARQCRDVIKR
ncbi:MAG: hypothetical protein QOH05_2958 [Acetobacteraceae bacterium]|jgi:hypothetical protein|nr:hypothetical protein [Acetobacteraceae bacterium]